MSLQDPIADMLTRIRNAQQAKHDSVSMSSSKIKLAIAKVLKEEGFIVDYLESEGNKKTINITLKYFDGKGAILSIDRKSRPGLRRYQKAKDLDRVLGGLGLAIVSTSKGVMSADNARANNLGGEVLCWIT
jgi:small subunit ribosomal protein S8